MDVLFTSIGTQQKTEWSDIQNSATRRHETPHRQTQPGTVSRLSFQKARVLIIRGNMGCHDHCTTPRRQTVARGPQEISVPQAILRCYKYASLLSHPAPLQPRSAPGVRQLDGPLHAACFLRADRRRLWRICSSVGLIDGLGDLLADPESPLPRFLAEACAPACKEHNIVLYDLRLRRPLCQQHCQQLARVIASCATPECRNYFQEQDTPHLTKTGVQRLPRKLRRTFTADIWRVTRCWKPSAGVAGVWGV